MILGFVPVIISKNILSQKSQTNTDYISLDIFHYADYVILNRFTQIILFSIKF